MPISALQEQIESRIKRAIADHIFPACVVGVITPTMGKMVLPFGSFTDDPLSAPVKENSIFDVASITKAIPTSCLALKLIDEGRLILENPVFHFLPELHGEHREKILVHHLLTQTLEWNFKLSSYKDRSADEILEHILSLPLRKNPGTTFHYSNATSILLGLVVERVLNQPLDRLAEEIFFKPIQMTRTSFRTNQFNLSEIVPTEIDPWRGRVIQGETHDESAYQLQSKFYVGSAGLFSTAPDLLRFMEMLLQGGSSNGKLFFSSLMIKAMRERFIESSFFPVSLGWELDQKHYMGNFSSPITFGKTGFTGCSCICDVNRGTALVILSNYTFPQRKPDASLINEVRRDVANIVFQKI